MLATHKWVGLTLAGIYLLLFFWGLVAWIRNRHPGESFWRTLALAQVGLLVPAVTGGILYFSGLRAPLLHYAYGAFPVVALVLAHRYARRFEGLEWAVFAVAALFTFGLLVRSYMTGMGQ